MYKTKLHKGVDVKMRAYFTNLFLRYYFIWIGSKGSRTGLHKDTDDQNYLLQIYGTKKVILFKSNNDDIFKVREEKEGGATLSSIDYWKEGINTEHQEIILNPGDILSIPPGWWHCAENLTETIAISCRSESLTGLLSKLLYGG
jgi:ribosomal protein L16 Arg81 hydroxylase